MAIEIDASAFSGPWMFPCTACPCGRVFIITRRYADGTYSAVVSPPAESGVYGRIQYIPVDGSWPEGLYDANGTLIASAGD